MAGSETRPLDLVNTGSPGRILRRAAGSKRAWATMIGILAVTAILPTTAKVPVAIGLGAAFFVPVLRDLARQPPRRVAAKAPVDSQRPIRFEAFKANAGGPRPRWRQVRMVLDGSELQVASYWRRSRREVFSLKGARLVALSTSGRGDRPLKPDRMRMLELELRDGRPLRLAVDLSVADEVTQAVQGCA